MRIFWWLRMWLRMMSNAGVGLLLLKSEGSLLECPRTYRLVSFMLICWIAFEAKASG
jgi:hypothetical protein